MPNQLSLDRAIKRVLKQWHQPAATENPLAELFQYRRALLQQSLSPKQISNRLINDGLHQLMESHPHYSDLLRLRFIENKPPRRVADTLNLSESHFYRL